MSSRRSGRAKAPVKYTSDSDGSDFGNKKPRKTASKAKATSKKRTKAEQDPSADTDGTPKKRTKKDPEVLAAEYAERAKAQQEKAATKQHKKEWEEWLAENDVEGKLLDAEPAKEESITQTDSLKKYGLKANELGVLAHAEKRHPIYNNTTKLFVEAEVRVLAFRKFGMLGGVQGSEEEVLRKGEEKWREEHKDDPVEAPTLKKADKPEKSKSAKQKWAAYVDSHTLASNDKLADEPQEAINQTESKTKYSLTPADLAVLPFFPKPNQKYGNTTKLFKESEVKVLAYRKAAYLGGVEEGDEEVVLEKGKELFEEGKNGA